MAPTFTFKLGGLDLSTYLRVNPDDHMDPEGAPWVQPAWADTPFSDGQALISTTVQNREQTWPLFLVDASRGKDALHALIQSINNAALVRPLLLEWKDSNATNSTFFDVSFVRFEPDFNFRRSGHGYAAGILRVFTTGYGHTGTTRVTATANGTGIFLSVPIASVGGDAPALLDTTIVSGAVLPSLGRIVAIAPITNPSYPAQIPAASLTDLQTNAALTGASGADGSRYLALPVSPTGGASGVACKVPLPNPTIAGGDNRILGVVKSGIDAGVGIYAQDPYGNSLGATAVASNSQGWALVDLGVCRLPTVGFPTLPKVSIFAGAIWASGAGGPVILASPAALAINEIFVLPDKNLTLIYERNIGGSVVSVDGFDGNSALAGTNDQRGNPWTTAHNDFTTQGITLSRSGVGYLQLGSGGTNIDAAVVANLYTDSMLISVKPWFDSAANSPSGSDVRLLKDTAASQFVQARLLNKGNATYALDLSAATNTAVPNLLASLALATLSLQQQYRLLMQVQGQTAFVNLSRDDGGPVFIPGSAAYASVGVTGNAAVAAAGNPGIAISNYATHNGPHMDSWEVDTIPSSNYFAYDNYRIDGPDVDSYRTSSAGVFAGQKLVSVQRGAFPKMTPSTTSLAVICAPVDQGVANDIVSTVVSVKERFTYGR